jgi:type IV secretion system protein VirD4
MMPKVKYYEDRILKTLFESQTGPLPEPEPLKAVTEPASFLAALTGEEPAKRGSAHDPNDLEMGQEPENEIRVPSQVEQIQAAFEAEDFADAHDDVQELQQQRIAREALQQPEFEDEPQIEYEKTAQQALLERIIAVQERNRAQGISR